MSGISFFIRKFISVVLVLTLLISPEFSYAQSAFVSALPQPGALVPLSSAFVPVMLRGMNLYPQDPLRFDFIVDSGNTGSTSEEIKQESNRLVKYFFAAMTVPQNDLWVNLSPYEADRIIPDGLGKTELGRDMLAQDYILKQLSSSLLDPEKDLGKEFWARVYQQAQEEFGVTDVPVDVFNKVWIIPEKAEVFEKGTAVYVTQARLKVMLDVDRIAAPKTDDPAHDMAKDIIREVIIPAIEKEVNEGKNFATIRQIYQALILAKWYKQVVKESLLSKVYIDQQKIGGVELADPTIKDQIYSRYVEAFKKGVVNLIKEDHDAAGQQVPRKYFAGGQIFGGIPLTSTENEGLVKSSVVGADYKLALRIEPKKSGDRVQRRPLKGGQDYAMMTNPQEIEAQRQRLIAEHFGGSEERLNEALVDYQKAYKDLGKDVSLEDILKDEFLLVVDPKGEYIKDAFGQIEVRPRELVHLDGTWHRTAGVFVVDARGRTYMQQRSFAKKTKPGAWDVSAGGHLGLDADPKVGVGRELEEEFFNSQIKIDPERLMPLTADGQLVTSTGFEKGINEQAVFYVYLMNDEEKAKIEFQASEVNIPKKGEMIAPTQIIMDWLAQRDPLPSKADLLWLFGTKNTQQAYETAAYLNAPGNEELKVLITGGIGKPGNSVTITEAQAAEGLKEDAVKILDDLLDALDKNAVMQKFNIDPSNPKVDQDNLDRLMDKTTRASANIPEGLMFWAVLRSMGVADERILVDAQSTTTGENIAFGKKILGEKMPATIIAVQESAMELRAAESLRRGLGSDVKVYARASFLFEKKNKIGNMSFDAIRVRADRAIKEIDKITEEFKGEVVVPQETRAAYEALKVADKKLEVDLESLAFDADRLTSFTTEFVEKWGDVADPAKLPDGYSIGMLFFRGEAKAQLPHVQKLLGIMQAQKDKALFPFTTKEGFKKVYRSYLEDTLGLDQQILRERIAKANSRLFDQNKALINNRNGLSLVSFLNLGSKDAPFVETEPGTLDGLLREIEEVLGTDVIRSSQAKNLHMTIGAYVHPDKRGIPAQEPLSADELAAARSQVTGVLAQKPSEVRVYFKGIVISPSGRINMLGYPEILSQDDPENDTANTLRKDLGLVQGPMHVSLATFIDAEKIDEDAMVKVRALVRKYGEKPFGVLTMDKVSLLHHTNDLLENPEIIVDGNLGKDHPDKAQGEARTYRLTDPELKHIMDMVPAFRQKVLTPERLRYWQGIKQMVNPDNKLKSGLYIASAVDQQFWLATNALTGYFIDDNYLDLHTNNYRYDADPMYGTPIKEVAVDEKKALEQYTELKGRRLGATTETSELDDKALKPRALLSSEKTLPIFKQHLLAPLLLELFALGVTSVSIKPMTLNGQQAWQVSFSWKHPLDKEEKKRTLIYVHGEALEAFDHIKEPVDMFMEKGNSSAPPLRSWVQYPYHPDLQTAAEDTIKADIQSYRNFYERVLKGLSSEGVIVSSGENSLAFGAPVYTFSLFAQEQMAGALQDISPNKDVIDMEGQGLKFGYGPVKVFHKQATDKEVGGIDVRDIGITRKDGISRIRFDETALQEAIKDGFDGFAPVILSITPLKSPLMAMSQ